MSEIKVNFRDTVIVRESSLPVLTQIHGNVFFLLLMRFKNTSVSSNLTDSPF